MKNLKALALAGVLAIAGSAMAQDYNRVSLSYNNTHYGYNKDAKAEEGEDPSFSTNGFGINYIHGFSLSSQLPMYLEVGGNVNFNFYSKTEELTDFDGDETYVEKYKGQFQNINLQVPVNFAWRFNVVEDFTITPYVGINFRLNFVNKTRSFWDGDYEDKAEEDAAKEWTNLMKEWKKDGDNGVEKDEKWNMFQMGWQIGVNFQYSRYCLGVQYGTDFIPAYSHKFEEEGFKATPRINTGNLKISLGYCF